MLGIRQRERIIKTRYPFALKEANLRILLNFQSPDEFLWRLEGDKSSCVYQLLKDQIGKYIVSASLEYEENIFKALFYENNCEIGKDYAISLNLIEKEI